jgi:hypothetical protein
MNKWLVIAVAAALAAAYVLVPHMAVASIPSSPEITSAELQLAGFPFARGAYWVYQGTVKWTQDTQEMQKEITWKVEVVDVVQREHVTGYLLKGWPTDLANYQEGDSPADHVIIQVGPDQYYEANTDALTRLKSQDENEMLVGLVNSAQLMLDLPLFKGKMFGDTDQITRPDRFYCWQVGDEQAADLKGIKGLPSDFQGISYSLTFTTIADNQTVDFVPGLGIVKYVYVHHGTPAEADVQLVEYHAGNMK